MGRKALGCIVGGPVVLGLLWLLFYRPPGAAPTAPRTSMPPAAAWSPRPPGTSLPPKAPSPTPKPAQADRRLFRENLKADDGGRAFMFRGFVRQSGERCDDIESARMGAPGVWTVRCSPGYVYRFTFDGAGKLKSAARVK